MGVDSMCNPYEPHLIKLDEIIRESILEFCKENNIRLENLTAKPEGYNQPPCFIEYELTFAIPNLGKKYDTLIIVYWYKKDTISLSGFSKKIPADCKKILEMKDVIKASIKKGLRNELELLKKVFENEPALNELIENIKKLVKAKNLDCDLVNLKDMAMVVIPLCGDVITVFISKIDPNLCSITVSFKDKNKSEIMAELLKYHYNINVPVETDEYEVEVDLENVSKDKQLEIISKTIDALIAFHLL